MKIPKTEALESIRETFARPGPCTVAIEWVGGRPTDTGRTDYYELHVWRIGDDGCPQRQEWLTRIFASAAGYRLRRDGEAVMLGGCGYSKRYEIACALSAMVPGVTLRVEGGGGSSRFLDGHAV